MDTAGFTVDLTPWLSQASEILYIATAGLALFVIALSCIVGHNMTTAHADPPKPRKHARLPFFLAH